MRFSATRDTGQVLVFAVILIAVMAAFVTVLAGTLIGNTFTIRKETYGAQSLQLAEAGVDRAIWCLNHSTECAPAYSGETATIGAGSFDVSVQTTGSTRTIVSTGTVQGVSRTVRVVARTTTTDVSFFYGVQVGAGGLIMGNTAEVVGNVYSNGSIIASNNAKIRGSAIVAGGTALVPDQQQTLQSSDFTVGQTAAQTDAAQSFRAGESNVLNKVSLYIRKVGTPSNATVRIVPANNGSPATVELASGTLNASLVTGSYGWVDVTFTSNPALVDGATYWIVIDVGNNNSSRYFVWGKHDNSGYGNGVGKFSSNWSGGSWSDADGDFGFQTWMGGVITKISGLEVPNIAGAVVRANTIESSNIGSGSGSGVSTFCTTMTSTTVAGDVQCGAITSSTIAGNVTTETLTSSTIAGDVTCESQSGNTISGTVNCPTAVDPPADPAPENLPISGANIDDWRADAQSGGTINGDLVLSTDQNLGPKEVTGSLSFGANGVEVTLTGTLYVHGNITISNNSAFRCDPGYGTQSCIIVADGWIDVENNGTFLGSGDPSSFILMLSTSTCNAAGPNCTAGGAAIEVHNSAEGVVFYSAYGKTFVHNSVALTEVTAYTLHLDNTAIITYNQGLASTVFGSGPGASWKIAEQTWEEI